MKNKSCLSGVLTTKAFTLIELLVVVLIIGILAAVALPQYQMAVAKVRVNRLLPLMKSIESAQEVYKIANGTYSKDFSLLDIDMPAGANATSTEKEVNYADFSCYTRGIIPSTTDSLYCKDTHYKFSLEKYYTSGTYCWFPDNDDFSRKLCGYICGTKTFGKVGEDTGYCYYQ